MSKYTVTMSNPSHPNQTIEADSADLDTEYGHLFLKDAKGEHVATFARGAFASVVKTG